MRSDNSNSTRLLNNRRLLLPGLMVAALLLFACLFWSITLGAAEIERATGFSALLQPDETEFEHLIIQTVRLPRVLAGALMGIALAVAGAIMQALTRNPLADSGILGINAGAAFAGQDGRGRFFTDLGFVVPDEHNELAGDQFYYALSEERVDLLDQDLLVFLALQFYEGGSEAAIEAINTDPLLSQFDVVQDGRVFFVADEYDAVLNFGTVLSLQYILEYMVPEIAQLLPLECDAGMRAVVDAVGAMICVPEAPQHVVALQEGDIDGLLAQLKAIAPDPEYSRPGFRSVESRVEMSHRMETEHATALDDKLNYAQYEVAQKEKYLDLALKQEL